MTPWGTITVAVLTSGAAGTALGALLTSRRERKGAIRAHAIDEVAQFSEDAARWYELAGAAITGRDEGNEGELAAFEAADAAVKDARARVGRIIVALGGPDTAVARDAIGIVTCLELAVEEIREWPPLIEDDEFPPEEGKTEREIEDEAAEVFEEKWEETIAESRMWLGFGWEMFGHFARNAAEHLDPTARGRAQRLERRVPTQLRHPVRYQRARGRQRREASDHRREIERLLERRRKVEMAKDGEPPSPDRAQTGLERPTGE